MLKYASYLLPLFMKGAARKPAKHLAGFAFAYALIGISFIFFFTAIFIWVTKIYNIETAFAATGVVLLLVALIFLMILKRPKTKEIAMVRAEENDPLADLIPETMKENPAIQKLVAQISDTPLASTAIALVIGMVLAREIFEE